MVQAYTQAPQVTAGCSGAFCSGAVCRSVFSHRHTSIGPVRARSFRILGFWVVYRPLDLNWYIGRGRIAQSCGLLMAVNLVIRCCKSPCKSSTLQNCQLNWLPDQCACQNHLDPLPEQVRWRRGLFMEGLGEDWVRSGPNCWGIRGGRILVAVMHAESYSPFSASTRLHILLGCTLTK